LRRKNKVHCYYTNALIDSWFAISDSAFPRCPVRLIATPRIERPSRRAAVNPA
jgi:hypothetical protein